MSLQPWWPAFACAAVVAVVTGSLAWRRRARTPAATALAVTMAGIAVWSAADALVYGLDAEPVRVAFPAVLMAAVGLVVAGVYVLARTLADPSWRLRPRTVALLAVEPLLVVLAAVLPATSALVMSRPGAGAVTEVDFGPVFLAHTGYSYLLLGIAYLHLARRWRTATDVFRRQIGVLLGAALLSTVGNVVTVAAQNDGHGADVTPLFFLVTGLVNCWAIFRLGLLRLVPVAREQVVDTVPDAVLVVDPEERVIDLNPAAVRMLERLRPGVGANVVGRGLHEVAGPAAAGVLDRTADTDGHRLAEVAPGLWLDVRGSEVADARGRPLGRIVVVRDVSEEHGRRLAVERLNQELADQVAEVERLRAVLAEEAVRDPLTGLHNRRHLDRVLATDLAGATARRPVSVLLVDVDHFKAVNDRHGHATGDRVLQAVARVLAEAARADDTVARLGGEEFVVVLPGAGRGEAAERAESIRRRCAALPHEGPAGTPAVTVSVGVAEGPHDGADPAGLLARADEAVYAAKAAGRDRVVVASPAAPRATAVPVG
ncbi:MULTISPECIES: histidine kinase N-terminal 7TM domain-containing diguanylate cyclase [unclassified Blastococcus]